MSWRYIPFQRYDPYVKTGLNDVALAVVQDGRDPVVWLAGWERDCINVGRDQVVEEEVDIEAVRQEGIPIVRRQGGGGTTYLTRDGEITWHLAAPETYFADDVNQIYSAVCGTVVEALSTLGIQAEHEPVNDVVTENGKISGATLRQENGGVYVAGTLLYNVEVEEMFRFLTPSEEKLENKPVETFRERVTSVTAETDAGFNDAKNALRQAFLDGREWEEGQWSEEEIKTAERKAKKYSSDEWVFQK